MRPHFIGIGAQKCASSWLYDILADHPDVCVSEQKELDFFSYRYENGYRWYEQHFDLNLDASIAGEISPSYFHEASVPQRLSVYRPDARILVSLRDPVERALSQHRHMVRIGMVDGPDLSFESALQTNPSYLEQGFYAAHLSRWLARFPREQMHILLMDDIRQDAAAAAREVYRFLGISSAHCSMAVGQKSNPSYALRSRAVNGVVCGARGAAARLGLSAIWHGLGNLGLRRAYRSMNRISSEAVIPPVAPETLAHLRNLFRSDIEQLAQMLDRPLDGWLRP